MLKLLIILFFIINYNSIIFAQQKEYKLVQFSENSDIDIDLFKKFDDYEFQSNDSIKKAFSPIKGEYLIYFFIATFEGESKNRGIQTFHDYLILKVDPKSKNILDGFQHTFEWAEPPNMVDLYRVSELNVKLENEMRIDKLKLKIFDIEYISHGEYLKDDGIILLE